MIMRCFLTITLCLAFVPARAQIVFPRRRRFAYVLMACILSGLAHVAPAQTSATRTYINPLDVNYQYNFEQQNEGVSYRSGADPVIINHKGEYYLFSTIALGWWHSTDLASWRHVRPTKWNDRGVVAPAALSVRDTLFLLPSTYDRLPIYSTTEPATGRLDYYNRLLPFMPEVRGPWDPAFFHDPDTGEWYLYFGSSNLYPIYGIQLDPARRLSYVGIPKELILLDPDEHGWERFGRDHRSDIDPFMEGAWMTKHGGRYYLQYGAPGTEYNVYANGTYVGDHPLGPFEYAPYNPVSYKPGGFVTGAGHGNTFQDAYGNYWNTGTPWVAVNWNFERRIAMFPAGFDDDGHMFATTRFGDFPHWVPTEQWTDPDELFTGWMLLSYRKPAVASSVRDTFEVARVTDENPRTFWVAETNTPGETVTLDLGSVYDVKALQVNYTDHESDIYLSDSTVYTEFRMHGSLDGNDWFVLADLTALPDSERRDRPNAYIELPTPRDARYIRYDHVYVASPNLAISDIRVFGNGDGPPPSTPTGLTARRDTDPRNAFLTWEPVADAVGYNIRWGIAPDKLYQTYQVWADAGSGLEIRALNAGQEYYFVIEAFNENEVSGLSDVIHTPP